MDDSTIVTAMTETMTEDSSIGDNLEDLTVLDLEIESLKREPNSVVEVFILIVSHIKDNNKIGANHISKV